MKKQTVAVMLILLMTGMLAGCGDDLGPDIPAITPYETSSALQEESTPVSESQPESSVQPEESSEPEQPDEKAESSQPEETDALIPEPLREIPITISAAGDVTLGNYKGQEFSNSFRQTYENTEDKSYFFANVADIFRQDDMTIVNLEGTLTFSEDFAEGRTFNIKGDPAYAFLLKEGSVEAVSMANNHRMDYKEEGSQDTVNALMEAGISYAYDGNVGIYETKGIQIGWVSVNEVGMGPAVEKYLEKGITGLKEQGVHLVLACCHWGIERDNYPEDYQKELGRKCIDWGADLVIGHHPHVLQGIDQYQGKYIIYSLGNFCFGANRNPADKDTMIYQQTFTFSPKEAEDGQVTYTLSEESEARVIPCSISSVTFRNNYQPTPLTGDEGQRVIGRINEYSRDFGVSADEDGVLRYEAMTE